MLVIDKAKALILKLKDPERVLSVISSAKKIVVQGQELVAVPHKQDEVKVLRNMGFKAPAPILHYYNWPGHYTPFEHQRRTSAFLTMHKRCIVLNSIGTGKTQSALWAADYLMKKGLVRKVLILSPLSTLERVWNDGVFIHFPHRTGVVLHGSAERRLRLLQTKADFYIINHDGFRIVAPHLKDFDLIIVDEATVFRNPTTQRFKSFSKWLEKQPDVRLWLMTGTPTPNEPTDAWALAKLVDSPYIPKTYTAFREQVMTKVGAYKYVPRHDAAEIVSGILQPSIRFTRDECLDLPPTLYQTRKVPLTADQRAHYDTMWKHLVTEVLTEGSISAANEAVKIQKLVQIACIAGGTDVLTSRGWVPIETVMPYDTVWDGEQWVPQGGVVHKGRRPTIDLGGVRMTPDHKVLTNSGWVEAKDVTIGKPCSRLNRKKVRFPASVGPGWDFSEQMCSVAVPLRLRDESSSCKSVPQNQIPEHAEELRVPPRKPNPLHDQHQTVSDMDTYEAALLRPQVQGLPPLGRTRDNNVPAMGIQLRELLEGYADRVCSRAIYREDRQRRQLRAGKLPLGNTKTASEQPTHEVYDLINCGPRNRFVVRGTTGECLIVHNCGVAYGDDGRNIEIDCAPRVDAVREVITEVGGKVIVFVPLTGTLHMLERELSKEWSVAVVNGEVPASKRNQIFHDFQHSADPKVLIAHPATMAHGLTLTAASTVVWYGPINSNETYVQACGRIERIGKQHTSLVVHIEATPLEDKMYKRLENKQSLQGLLLDMLQSQQEKHL